MQLLQMLTGGSSKKTTPQQQWQNQVSTGQKLTTQDISRLPQQQQSNAQIYNQNPQDPRVTNIDPALFGYKADDTLQMGKPKQYLQGANNNSSSAIDIQGRTNPGYIPLQNSGLGGKGYTANLQPAQNPQLNQLLDLLKRRR